VSSPSHLLPLNWAVSPGQNTSVYLTLASVPKNVGQTETVRHREKLGTGCYEGSL
jgi:hypothetical protein